MNDVNGGGTLSDKAGALWRRFRKRSKPSRSNDGDVLRDHGLRVCNIIVCEYLLILIRARWDASNA